MFCGKCGTKIENNINFCPSCGNPIQKEDNSESHMKNSKQSHETSTNTKSNKTQPTYNNAPGGFGKVIAILAFLGVLVLLIISIENSDSGNDYSYDDTTIDPESCIQYNTFSNSLNQAEISFRSDQFSYSSGMPVDVAHGYFEVVDDNTIRLISAQASTSLPRYARFVDCNTLSISGGRYTR
jgi:hypothetical protein